MKQTAVEWYAQQLGVTTGTTLERALEMEKGQMRLADKNGRDRNQYEHDCKYGGVEYWDSVPKPFEEYYNETFNTKEK